MLHQSNQRSSKKSETSRDAFATSGARGVPYVGFNSGYGSRINFNGVRFTTFARIFLKMPGIDQQSALAYDKYPVMPQRWKILSLVTFFGFFSLS